MAPSNRRDDEEQLNGFNQAESFPPYRDDPNDDNNDDDLLPDAPLQPQRPSLELDNDPLTTHQPPTLRERISSRISPRLKSAWRSTVTWVEGPKPPRIYTITPIFPKVQHSPIQLLDRYAPKKVHKFWLLVAVYASWLLAFSLILWKSSFASSVPGYGAPIRLGCTARYWREGNGCGLNGDLCRPFTNTTLAFRCPADCDRVEILNPHAVGDQEVVYKPLVVGGPMDHRTGFEGELYDDAIYRGDSFICASAIHSGFIKAPTGGCGVITLTGTQHTFPSTKNAGIKSTSFAASFPHTFGFLKGTLSPCADLRWPALAVSVIFTTLLSLFTTSPGVFFFSVYTILFLHVGLASDPPPMTNYASLLSLALGRFLPATFCAWVTYRYTVLRSLTDLTAQVEKTILWLGPAWVGALNNYTFDKIPIQRLTPHDIQAQPGAVPALIIVVLSIFSIALGQAWAFRVEGRMPRYLVIYGIFVGTLLILLTLPGLGLRIHHYILALLLLPGTSFQNRPSLVYQGLLVGLFVNGIARWGFAPIVETVTSLLEGTQMGTLLPPVAVIATAGVKNITFDFGPLPVWDQKAEVEWDGISVLVNDVERFRGYGGEKERWPDGWVPGGNYTWTWTRHEQAEAGVSESKNGKDVLPQYFRFGYMSGSSAGDFTKAGTWDEAGEWKEMEKGPSR